MTIKPAAELVRAANEAVDQATADQAEEWLGRGDVQFVDVREPAEWAQGHVPGAVHIPRGLLEFQADPTASSFVTALAEKKLVIYCAVGGRSALAAKTLKDMGYEDVTNLQGGFTGWTQAGKPQEG